MGQRIDFSVKIALLIGDGRKNGTERRSVVSGGGIVADHDDHLQPVPFFLAGEVDHLAVDFSKSLGSGAGEVEDDHFGIDLDHQRIGSIRGAFGDVSGFETSVAVDLFSQQPPIGGVYFEGDRFFGDEILHRKEKTEASVSFDIDPVFAVDSASADELNVADFDKMALIFVVDGTSVGWFQNTVDTVTFHE